MDSVDKDATTRPTTKVLPREGTNMNNYAALLGLWLQLSRPGRRDERGLSQSTENAILLAGAVAIALIIVGAITVFVQDNLPG